LIELNRAQLDVEEQEDRQGHGLSDWTSLGFHVIDDMSQQRQLHPSNRSFPKFCYLISKLFFGQQLVCFSQRKKKNASEIVKLMPVAALLED